MIWYCLCSNVATVAAISTAIRDWIWGLQERVATFIEQVIAPPSPELAGAMPEIPKLREVDILSV